MRCFLFADAGVANPDIGIGGLSDKTSFANYYELPGKGYGGKKEEFVRIVDYDNRCWQSLGSKEAILGKAGYKAAKADTDKCSPVLVRPRMEAVMSHAIIAAPGSETGELLVGYPFTSVSTSSTGLLFVRDVCVHANLLCRCGDAAADIRLLFAPLQKLSRSSFVCTSAVCSSDRKMSSS